VETIVRESEPRIAPVDVQVGIVDGGRVQLLGGIEEGTEVLLK
jgi:hypothetical protein